MDLSLIISVSGRSPDWTRLFSPYPNFSASALLGTITQPTKARAAATSVVARFVCDSPWHSQRHSRAISFPLSRFGHFNNAFSRASSYTSC